MRDPAPLLLTPEATIRTALQRIDAGGAQIALVVDDSRRLLGTVTDGDVRRGILAGRDLGDPVSGVMNPAPSTATIADGRDRVLALMRRRRIHQVPIVDAAGVVLGLELLDELLVPGALPHEVVLLAGGKGTRLHPITHEIPKPLVRVGDRPILERIITTLAEHGFRRFHLAVNHLASQIEDHFGDGARWGVSIDYLREDQPLGTAGALGLLASPPTHPFLVMNGDLLTTVNPRNLLDFHARDGAEATMCVREFDQEVPYGVVRMEGSRFLGVDEKPVQRFYVNAGIYALSPSLLNLLTPGEPLHMTALFGRLHEAGRRAAVFPVREYWLDIGRPPDLERARGDVARVFDEEPS